MRAAHQVLVGASAGDAISGMALAIREALRGIAPSEMYALHIDPSAAGYVRPIATLPRGRSDGVLVYHASYGEPAMTRVLLDRPERLVLVYHNITPSQFFLDVDPAFASGLEWGRHELSCLRESTVLSVADSTFNARDLTAMGFDDVHVIPAGIAPHRLSGFPSDEAAVSLLAEHVPGGYVLSVSQLLPHKRHEVVLQAIHLVQTLHQRDLGVVIAGPGRSQLYTSALTQQARQLQVRGAWFAGRVSDAALATLYRNASAYVSASEHEGLGLPSLEAMSFGVPVLARDAGAVRETVGDAAIVLPADAGPILFAEAIDTVCIDNDLRSGLVAAGRSRLAALPSPEASAAALGALVRQVF